MSSHLHAHPLHRAAASSAAADAMGRRGEATTAIGHGARCVFFSLAPPGAASG